MSETGTVRQCMYENVAEISNLNKVDGFDPRKYMRLLQSEGQGTKYYLDVAYRKLWFRLKYPNGKIVKKLVKLTEQVAIVEAKVYLDRNDPEEGFISNALAQKYMTADDQLGNKYVELAETAAVGRALADAGFGLQFADMEGEADPQIVDAPMEQRGNRTIPAGTCMDEDGEVIGSPDNGIGTDSTEQAGQEISDDNLPGQYDIGEYIPMPDSNGNQAGQAPGMTPALGQKASVIGSHASKPQGGQTHTGIKKDMPVEQIYPLLNRDSAAAVVISAGYHKGKTLGQLALEKPTSLEWYITSYGGPDNILRAAAKFLLDTALGQAG